MAVREFNERAGIIPLIDNFYGFGIDSKYHTLMDFGGHREISDRSIYETAIRECREESFGLLEVSLIELQKRETLHLHEPRCDIFIVPMSGINPSLLSNEFAKQVLEAQFTGRVIESDNVVWIGYEELKDFLKYPKFWYPPVFNCLRQIQ